MKLGLKLSVAAMMSIYLTDCDDYYPLFCEVHCLTTEHLQIYLHIQYPLEGKEFTRTPGLGVYDMIHL